MSFAVSSLTFAALLFAYSKQTINIIVNSIVSYNLAETGLTDFAGHALKMEHFRPLHASP
jgi:hypothetical protein